MGFQNVVFLTSQTIFFPMVEVRERHISVKYGCVWTRLYSM